MRNLILLVVLLMSITVTSQTSIGIKAGINLSNLAVNEDQIDESKNKVDYTIGIVNHNQMGLLFVQSELLYNRKGAEYSAGGLTVDANLNYLQVPISVGISLLGSTINLYGGGYAAYLLNADYEYKNDADEVVATTNNKDAFNKLDFGVHTGLFVSISKINLDLRFSRGIRDVEGEDIITNLQTFTRNEAKNFNVELTASLFF